MWQIAIDVGNTNIVCGIFSEEKENYKIENTFRLSTSNSVTTDELAFNVLSILSHQGIDFKQIKSGIFASVVPDVNHNITKMMNNYFDFEIPIFNQKAAAKSLGVLYEDVQSLGMDRLVNVKAVEKLYGTPSIIIDFGTAITVDVLSAESCFLGGLILPGIAVSLESLVKKTSTLPMIALEHPKNILGNSTNECMQNGVYYLNSLGLDSIIDLIVKEYFDEEEKIYIVATGGLSRYVMRLSKKEIILEPHLSLIGLKVAFDEMINGTAF